MKFWYYKIFKLKSLLLDFVKKASTFSELAAGFIIFAVVMMRFVVYRKELEENEVVKKEKLPEIQNNQITTTSAFSQRYGLRKLEANDRTFVRRGCHRCNAAINDQKVSCFACEKIFHKNCAKPQATDENSQWRCSDCCSKLSGGRLTRRLRKQLKFYD